jgi:hypothetical protein
MEPLYLGPVVGYLMSRLRRDKTPATALAEAKAQRRFAGITDEEFQAALDRAIINEDAFQMLRVVMPHVIVGKDGKLTIE